MPERRNRHIVEIQDAVSQGIKSFLVVFENDCQDELMYGFLLEVSCEGTSIGGAIATEEGLTRIAKQYIKSDSNETLSNE